MNAVLVPDTVQAIWERLDREAPTYLVGGAVRDWLRGQPVHDWDMVTAVPPDRIPAVLADWPVKKVGKAFGVWWVGKGDPLIQVAGLQQTGADSDHRRVGRIAIEADLARRDFTINAMALQRDGTVIDPFGGQRDLFDQVGGRVLPLVRTVGPAAERFWEDPLRMVRALRFVAQLPGQLEGSLVQEIGKSVGWLAYVSRERQWHEWWALCAGTAFWPAVELAHYTRVLDMLFPAWTHVRGFDQRSRYHVFSVDRHSVLVAAGLSDPLLRLTGLLHDIAKPQCFTVDTRGEGHFYHHAEKGALIAYQQLVQLRAPRWVAERVRQWIHWHLLPFESVRDSTLRRLLREYGGEWLLGLLELRRADWEAGAAQGWAAYPAQRERVERLIAEVPGVRLAVGGKEIMEWVGIPEGPAVGAWLRRIQAWVEEEPSRNTRECIREFVARGGAP